MQYLRADTANTVTIGPAVAVGDGFVPVTNLVGTSADEYEIIKHGATTTTAISAALSAISGADGYYSLVLSSGECDTEGRFTILINDDDLILPIKHEFMVVNTMVYDSLYAVVGTDLLDVQIAGMDVGVISSGSFAANAIRNTAINPDAFQADAFATGCFTADAFAANAIIAATLASNCITEFKIAPDAIGSSELSVTAVAKIADRILDEATSLHVAPGTVGEVLDNLPNDGALSNLDAAVTTRATPAQVQTELGTYDGPTDAEMIARTILSAAYFDPATDDVDVRSLQANVVTAAAINADAITAAKLAADVTTEIVAGMNDISTAEVLTQVNTALDAAITELSSEPGTTPSVREATMLMYMALRNRLDTFTSGSDLLRLYNNAGSIIASKALTDAGGDYSEAKMT